MQEKSIVGRHASNSIRPQWSRYFDALDLEGERLLATVGLRCDGGGDDRRAAARGPYCLQRARPLRAIRYDPRSDEIEVAVASDDSSDAALRYFVCTPQSISLQQFDHTKVISVRDASGLQTCIFLFEADVRLRAGAATTRRRRAARGPLAVAGDTTEPAP